MEPENVEITIAVIKIIWCIILIICGIKILKDMNKLEK